MNEQIAVLLGELEHWKRREMEGDIKLREVETQLLTIKCKVHGAIVLTTNTRWKQHSSREERNSLLKTLIKTLWGKAPGVMPEVHTEMLCQQSVYMMS